MTGSLQEILQYSMADLAFRAGCPYNCNNIRIEQFIEHIFS
jgi:hypothetical protein